MPDLLALVAERAAEARKATSERDAAIRQAVAEGQTLRAVATAAELSAPGVMKIRDRG